MIRYNGSELIGRPADPGREAGWEILGTEKDTFSLVLGSLPVSSHQSSTHRKHWFWLA